MKALHVGIWGLGLMGGSLALALRRGKEKLAAEGLTIEALYGFDGNRATVAAARARENLFHGVWPCRMTETEEERMAALQVETRLSEASLGEISKESGAADKNKQRQQAENEDCQQAENVLRELDVLFLALPLPVLCAAGPWLRNRTNALISDLGSVKTPLVQSFRGCRFIGGHPMCGSERCGFDCARADLFENAVYALCPPTGAAAAPMGMEADLLLLQALIRAVDARPLCVDAARHDRITALISHLPHLVAAALVNVAAEENDPLTCLLAAGGFKDITRIASSDAALWSGIATANSSELIGALDAMDAQLKRCREALIRQQTDEMVCFFNAAATCRDTIPEGLSGALTASAQLIVEVPDRPGELARITGRLAAAGINVNNVAIQNARPYEGGVLRLYLSDEAERKRASQVLTAEGYLCSE